MSSHQYYFYYGNGAVGGQLLVRGVGSPADWSRPSILSAQPQTATVQDAVWSFWSKPYAAYQHRNWLDYRSHLLSWVLSVRLAECQFPRLSLVTDDAGAELLVNRLRLPFSEVSTTLNALRNEDAGWWVLGKLYAYRQQERPFLHVDNDVFLWRSLGAELGADIVAQNPEHAPVADTTFYKPTWLTAVVDRHHGWLPAEWTSYVTNGGTRAVCAGILGGRRIGALRDYADRAIAAVQHHCNRSAWSAIGAEGQLTNSVLIEQYYLAAYCDARRREGDPIDIRYLFASQDEAASSDASTRMGYTHLMAGKHDRSLMQLLAERVRRDHPDDYRRCVRAAEAAR